MPGDPERVFASMGNYVFSTKTLIDLLYEDAQKPDSHHDFGKDILPKLAGNAEIFTYDFQTNRISGEPPDSVPYWRDVGTIEAYYEANMDLRSVSPALNLYNRAWPLRSTSFSDPPAKFTFDDENRRGQAIDSVVSGGCILSGGIVRNSVLGRGVRVHAGALVEDCVILDNCDIGRRAKVRRAILEKNVHIKEDDLIGYDEGDDRARGYHVTETGIVVVEGQRSAVDITGLVV
jgi:glucose-1-phosphate adenylyltransferase